jgi:hypothetical protein
MHYNTKSETLIENLAGSVDMKFSGGSPWNMDGQADVFHPIGRSGQFSRSRID